MVGYFVYYGLGFTGDLWWEYEVFRGVGVLIVDFIYVFGLFVFLGFFNEFVFLGFFDLVFNDYFLRKSSLVVRFYSVFSEFI